MSDPIRLEDLPAFLDLVEHAVSHPQAVGPIRRAAEHIAGELGRGFQSSIAPDGTAWPPLKRRRPRGHNPGTRPLIDTGEMMLSTISDASGHIEEIADDSLTYGTANRNVHGHVLAAIHQFGSQHIPARPFVGWTEASTDYATEAVADHLLAQVDAI